ncbi:MAG: LacI family DNA-binding transcriptional regulator [Pseudomonadota bacterium]
MNKPTVHDIAKEAGVSLATVDRVLNTRPGVREKTIAKVQAAIQRLGYVRDTTAANLARQRQYRFAFVLPEGPSQFVATLRSALKEASSRMVADRLLVRIVPIPAHDPNAIVQRLRMLDRARVDGVAIMAPETPQVRDAVLRLKQEGIVVVTLVSDLPNAPRDYFIGINSIAAGRTAGLLMGRFTSAPGDVLVMTNSLRSRDSLERRLGFDAVIDAEFTHLTPLPTIEWYDDPGRIGPILGDIARRRPRLVGLYSMGSGNGPIMDALGREGLAGRLVVIAHELTPTTGEGLRRGDIAAVITQNVGHLVRSSLRVLRTLSDKLPIFEAQERVRIEIVVRENIP